MPYKNFKELKEDNPDAVKNSEGDYLEKPDEGWHSFNEEAFTGIGYHGNELVYYSDNWEKTNS